MLRLLGHPFISLIEFFLGSGISRLLFEQLFKVQHKSVRDDVIQHINHRRPLKVQACSWLINRNIYSKAKKA